MIQLSCSMDASFDLEKVQNDFFVCQMNCFLASDLHYIQLLWLLLYSFVHLEFCVCFLKILPSGLYMLVSST